MKAKDPRVSRMSAIDITIGGEGMGPASVPVRALAELLQAAASAVEAMARAKGVEVPGIHLVAVKDGSAAYSLVSPSEQAGAVIVDLYEAAKERGKTSSPAVRHALTRLHSEAAKLGALRMRARPIHAGRARKEITVAAPIDDAAAGLESYAEIFGRVVGLFVTKDRRISIHVRIEEGRTEEFSADESLLTTATGLFSRFVRARVVYTDNGDTSEPLFIESLSPWDHAAGSDFAVAAAAFRTTLQAEGNEIDASAWLRELHADA
jgi:hypothetical protein